MVQERAKRNNFHPFKFEYFMSEIAFLIVCVAANNFSLKLINVLTHDIYYFKLF